MKLLQALILSTALWGAGAVAETPRLSLWITEAIGATNAAQCAQPAPHDSTKLAALRARATYQVEEADVALWDRATATWTLRDDGTPLRERAWKMADRCFILWIDGKAVATGVALWTYSARLVRMPVLSLSTEGGALSLRLGANHGGSSSIPVVPDRIDEVLKAVQGRNGPGAEGRTRTY